MIIRKKKRVLGCLPSSGPARSQNGPAPRRRPTRPEGARLVRVSSPLSYSLLRPLHTPLSVSRSPAFAASRRRQGRASGHSRPWSSSSGASPPPSTRQVSPPTPSLPFPRCEIEHPKPSRMLFAFRSVHSPAINFDFLFFCKKSSYTAPAPDCVVVSR